MFLLIVLGLVLPTKDWKITFSLWEGGGNPPWSSGSVTSYSFTFKNHFAFGPALLDDERHFEILEEKGLLSLFSNFSCLCQCFILIFHPFLPLFPFSLSLPLALVINKEWKARQNIPPRLLTMISLWGKFLETSERDSSGFSAHKFQLRWEQWPCCLPPKDKMRHGPCFLFLSQTSNLSKQSLLNPHGKLANTNTFFLSY